MSRPSPCPQLELLAPAGSAEAMAAALRAGADAVYFGAGELNMRARAARNFREDDLSKVARRCHAAGAKAYLTLNTVLYDEELPAVERLCGLAAKSGIDAVIAADPAAVQAARQAGLAVHLSTQANVSNLAAVRFHAAWADVIVLARELSLEQIEAVSRGIREQEIRGPSGELVRLEAFVHGAMCVAVSGHCGMSLAAYNHSANRGDCLQSCRRAYRVSDPETGTEFEIDNGYVMSPRDLCTIGCLDRLLASGIRVLKIEGRGRTADYVRETVGCYREAIESLATGTYDDSRIAVWRERLARVYNRGFWEGGHYLGVRTEVWSGSAGNQAPVKRFQAGEITNYFAKHQVAEALVRSHPLAVGDTLQIIGPTTGCLVARIGEGELRWNDQPVNRVERGEGVTFKVSGKVRRGDKVFVVEASR